MTIDKKTADALKQITDVCCKYKICNNCPLGGFTSDDMCLLDWTPKNWIINENGDGTYTPDIL